MGGHGGPWGAMGGHGGPWGAMGMIQVDPRQPLTPLARTAIQEASAKMRRHRFFFYMFFFSFLKPSRCFGLLVDFSFHCFLVFVFSSVSRHLAAVCFLGLFFAVNG